MKKVILSLACCALVAPLAFSKDTKHSKRTLAYIEPSVTVTAPNPNARMELGEVAAFQPVGSVVIKQDGAGRYVLDDPAHMFNRRGEAVNGILRAGTRVQVYFNGDNGSRTIDRIVVY